MKRWPASLRPSALQWVAFLAILYFALVAQAFHVIEPCSGAGGFLAALGCLEANEFGDLLAGIFAPLAFLGLGFAIYIQSQELRAQREELGATREEMRASRSVSEANVGFVAKQTEAAEKSASTVQKDRALDDYKKAGRTLARVMSLTFEPSMNVIWTIAGEATSAISLNKEFPELGEDTEAYLREMMVALGVFLKVYSYIDLGENGYSNFQEKWSYFKTMDDSFMLMAIAANKYYLYTSQVYPSVNFDILAQRLGEVRVRFRVVDPGVG